MHDKQLHHRLANIALRSSSVFAFAAIAVAVGCSGTSGIGGVDPLDGGSASATGEGSSGSSGSGSEDSGTGDTCPAECPENTVCSAGKCEPLPDTCPCPKESICDLGTGKCKVGCISNTDCNGGRYCDATSRTC